MKPIFKYTLLVTLIVLVSVVTYVLVMFSPIMAGHASKTMCSCIHVMGRSPQSVVEKELKVLPGLDMATFEMDSLSVTAHLLWATKKSIYRKGQGCTLLGEASEEQLRSQTPALPGPIPYDPDTIDWPMGNRLPDASLEDVNYEGIEAAINTAFDEPDKSKPKNTLAVVVVYYGQIIGERYAEGVNVRSRLMGWSMTKSLTNALVGILVKDGKLKTEEPAPVSIWQTDERKNITLGNLLQASSGLEWDESYFSPGDFHSMFTFSDDKGGYAASKPLKFPINEHFQYSSGTSNILSGIVRRTVGDENYPRFAYDRLFHKIGMADAMIEPDASGTLVGSSYGYSSARDWARFGLLFLQDGVWNGERILPEGWVAYSSTPAVAAPKGEYGAQFWLNAGAKGNPQDSHNAGLPNDEYGAEGFEEQSVFVIPSKQLVIVRLGISHHGFDIVGLTKQVIESVP